MRTWPLALLALTALTLLPHAAAQPGEYEFSEDYLARIGQGDIATTGLEEPAGAWNVAEYVRIDYDGNETAIPVATSQGDVLAVGCTCNDSRLEGSQIILPAGQDPGAYVVSMIRTIGEGDAAAFDLALFTGQQDSRIVAYVPTGSSVQTNAVLLRDVGSCQNGPCSIQEYAPSTGTWIAIVPGATADGGQATVPGDDDDGLMDDAFPFILGALAGMVLWAFLVQRGTVQKRRRQEVQKAAHVEAAAEGKEALAARKRVLMAGLKELEVAKMNKEIDSDVYDRLKAELKREAVTTMRALEASD